MFLLVDSGKVLCLFANELQQNSNACLEKNIILIFKWLFEGLNGVVAFTVIGWNNGYFTAIG